MAYKTYITDALVCGSRSYQVSDRSYLLFTREAGMILAVAKSVREERSKQRYGLQEFSCVRVTLVRGKELWRIAGVEPRENFYFASKDRDTRACARSVIQLLRRVVHGEVAHQELFDDVLVFLRAAPDFDQTVLLAALTLRTLYMLGYIAPDHELVTVCAPMDAANTMEQIIETTRAHMTKIQGVVEAGLAHSHL